MPNLVGHDNKRVICFKVFEYLSRFSNFPTAVHHVTLLTFLPDSVKQVVGNGAASASYAIKKKKYFWNISVSIKHEWELSFWIFDKHNRSLLDLCNTSL